MPSLKAANILLPAGCWVYEATVLKQSAGPQSLVVFGWAAAQFFGDCGGVHYPAVGVGDTNSSVGIAISYNTGFTLKSLDDEGDSLHDESAARQGSLRTPRSFA